MIVESLRKLAASGGGVICTAALLLMRSGVRSIPYYRGGDQFRWRWSPWFRALSFSWVFFT